MSAQYIQAPGSGVGIYQARASMLGGSPAVWQFSTRCCRPSRAAQQCVLPLTNQLLVLPITPQTSCRNLPACPQGTDGFMYCDGLRIDDIRAAADSSPFYLYSKERIRCVLQPRCCCGGGGPAPRQCHRCAAVS